MLDDPTFMFALALVALVLAAIATVQSRFVSILAWSAVAGFSALSLFLHTQV